MLEISDEELAVRRAEWAPTAAPPSSDYAWLYNDLIGGADTGAELDFLMGCRGRDVG